MRRSSGAGRSDSRRPAPEVHLERYLEIVEELKTTKTARRAAASARAYGGSVTS